MDKVIIYSASVGETDVWVKATYTPGRPETGPSLASPGEPAEEPYIEIIDVRLQCQKDEIDIEGLFIRKQLSQGEYFYESIEDLLRNSAIEYVRGIEE